MAEYHPTKTDKTDEQKLGAYEALERLNDLLTLLDTTKQTE